MPSVRRALQDALAELAAIQKGDIEGARQELRRVLSLQGDRREEAKRFLDELH